MVELKRGDEVTVNGRWFRIGVNDGGRPLFVPLSKPSEPQQDADADDPIFDTVQDSHD